MWSSFGASVRVHAIAWAQSGGQVGFVELMSSHEINLITCGWLILVNCGVLSLVEGSGSVFETDRVLAVKRTRSVYGQVVARE